MSSVAQVGCWFIDEAREPAVRSLRQFAEEEVILPEDGGPHQGERFSCDFQPAFGLFFDEIDSERWSRVAGTAPTQVGKSACVFVIPMVHALFELRENVVCGIPDMRMAHDKWTQDISPIIDASPSLAAQLPHSGEGSKGGKVHSEVTFRNGATLRFMSAGGKDTGRAGFTARVLAITEADAMGRTSQDSVSVEANPVEQLQGRLRSHRLQERRIFLEGTVGIEHGLIWQEYIHGSAARIMLRCPHCRVWVSSEREHLIGWEEAESQWEAFDNTHWICPDCAEAWTEEQRQEANHDARLCHKGQTINKRGRVEGPVPEVFTFGFRMSAVNNLFLHASDLGAELWHDRATLPEDDFEKKTSQQVFAVPWQPPEIDLAPLEVADVIERVNGPKKGIIPRDSIAITVGIDTGLDQLNWTAIAWTPDGSGRIVEYGEYPVERKLGAAKDLFNAFVGLCKLLEFAAEDGRKMGAAQIWIDAHYHRHTNAVFAFVRHMRAEEKSRLGWERFRACWGEGFSNHMAGRYRHPTKMDKQIRHIGREYYFKLVPQQQAFRTHVNADHWKTEVRDKMALPLDQAGALSLYTAAPKEHEAFSKQLCAERPVRQWTQEKGEFEVWIRVNRANHKLDATYLAVCAGHFVLTMHARKKAAPKRAPIPRQPGEAEETYLVAHR